jgi:hypothetical protein
VDSYLFNSARPAPSTYVQFGDESERYPCDWSPSLPAFGFADWRARVYGRRNPGDREQVRITSALGVFVGEAYVASVAAAPGEIESELVGAGELRYEPQAEAQTFIGPTT